MGVTKQTNAGEIVQGFAAASRFGLAPCFLPPERLGYLKIKQMRGVKCLAGMKQPVCGSVGR